jgi:hypothetical protein
MVFCCVDFHKTQNHAVRFCGHLMYQFLSKLNENVEKKQAKFYLRLEVNVPELIIAQWHYVELSCIRLCPSP